MNAIVKYTKNVVIKNNLASNEEFENALQFSEENSDSNILKALITLKILSREQAVKIKNGFTVSQKKRKQENVTSHKDVADVTDKDTSENNNVKETSEKVENTIAAMKIEGGTELEKYLRAAKLKGASDVHIIAGSKPLMRINGMLMPMSDEIIKKEEASKIILADLSEKQLQLFNDNKYIECCLVYNQTERYRTCVVNQHRGIDGSFRIIADETPTLESLGLPEDLKRLTTYATGIIFLTGPSGTGKSSTMAALIDIINQDRDDHIITMEDPIEFVFDSKNCHISQRQLNDHTESFSAALRGALREDPDIIILGEMRDYETASLALSAAETGHLVMTTLHTTSAVKTIERVLDMFPPEQVSQVRSMLSKSLRAVICQKLIPNAKEEGRVAALEIMYNNNPISNLISSDKMISVPSTIQTSKSEGMILMDNYIKDLLGKGLISQEDAIKFADDRKQFEKKKSTRRNKE